MKYKQCYNKFICSNKPIDILIYGAYTPGIQPSELTKKYFVNHDYITFNLCYELRHRLITKILKDAKLKELNIKIIQISYNIRGS